MPVRGRIQRRREGHIPGSASAHEFRRAPAQERPSSRHRRAAPRRGSGGGGGNRSQIHLASRRDRSALGRDPLGWRWDRCHRGGQRQDEDYGGGRMKLANVVTWSGLLLGILWVMGAPWYFALLSLALDVVDGWVARRLGPTTYGAELDWHVDCALAALIAWSIS